MTRVFGLMAAALAFSLVCYSGVQAGAKEGKMRWSHKKTGACKWSEALIVPEAKNNQPGILTLKITFKAKELAEFFVIGDGDSDLDLVVKDASGNTVAKDVDPPANKGGGSDMCVCRWTPEVEQEYTIIIINNDPITNIAMAGTN